MLVITQIQNPCGTKVKDLKYFNIHKTLCPIKNLVCVMYTLQIMFKKCFFSYTTVQNICLVNIFLVVETHVTRYNKIIKYDRFCKIQFAKS